jgi:hypothetical protein
MNKVAVLLVLLAGVLLVPGAASADHLSTRDPREFRGRFDIARVWHGHGARGGGTWLKHGVKMYRGWHSRALRSRGSVDITFPGRRRYIRFDFRRGLKARMYDHDGELVGKPLAWRPNLKTLIVSFPRGWLGDNVSRYSWLVESTSTPPCDDTTASCAGFVDRAPDAGRIVHVLEGGR